MAYDETQGERCGHANSGKLRQTQGNLGKFKQTQANSGEFAPVHKRTRWNWKGRVTNGYANSASGNVCPSDRTCVFSGLNATRLTGHAPCWRDMHHMNNNR
eukprot:39239-Prorocentrum_minimum.AAC.1